MSTLDAGVAMMSADEIDEVAYRVHDELASDDVLRTDDMEVGYRFERDEFVTSVVDYTLDIPVGQRAEQRYYDAAKDAFEQTAKDPSNVTPPAVSWDTHYWSDVSTSVVRDAVAAVLTEKTRSSGS